MKVSVVIPTKNRPAQLRDLLASLCTQDHPLHELIVVDDSDRHTFDSIGLAFAIHVKKMNQEPELIHVRGTNQGTSHARNQGASYCKGDIILFLDDDVILERGFISAIVEPFKEKDVAGVGGVITNIPPMGWLERTFKRVFLLSITTDNRAYLRPSGYPCHLDNCDRIIPVGVLSGCNMALRTEVFNKFQFDEELLGYAYLEDVDLSSRISRAYKLLATPRARLVHNMKPKTPSERFQTVKAHYHHLVFRKMPGKGFKEYSAFYWSLIGNLIQATSASIDNRTFPLEGLKVFSAMQV